MEVFLLTLLSLLLLVLAIIKVAQWNKSRFDCRGFNKKSGHHKNGTLYDNQGFDKYGYDSSGYDINGFDKNGYNRKGYTAGNSTYPRCCMPRVYKDCISIINYDHCAILESTQKNTLCPFYKENPNYSKSNNVDDTYGCLGFAKTTDIVDWGHKVITRETDDEFSETEEYELYDYFLKMYLDFMENN